MAPAAPLSELRQDVHPLGEALKERAADVVDLTVARASRLALDPALQRTAERISKASTIALASWLAGEGGRDAVAEVLQQSAAARAPTHNRAARCAHSDR